MTKEKSLKKMKRIKQMCKYILVVEAFAILITSSYAWYRYSSSKSIQTASADVEKLVTLSLLDDTATQVLQLFVGNLYPGQSNQLVVCISNDPMDGTKRTMEDMGYELKLAHTNNLPVSYHLYPLSKVTKDDAFDVHVDHSKDSLEDTYFAIDKDLEGNKSSFPYTMETNADVMKPTISPGEEDWVNEPGYQVYDQNFKLTMSDGHYDHNYYLLEINMPKKLPDDIQFSDIKKEVDMVYIIATVKQLQ